MKIKNKGKGKAEILIYEEIGEGWFGGIGAKRFAEDVKALGDVSEINVRINSDGGNVFDGIAMYNTLIRNKARIVVDIDGLAASIASVLAMAGDEINIASNGTLMIHNPWAVAAGYADEIRKQAELLDQVRDQLIDTYARQASISKERIGELMNDESWLTADQAIEHGFVHNITGEIQIAAANFKMLNKFKNTPQTLLDNKNVVQTETTEPALNDAGVKMSKMANRVRAIQ